MLGEDALGEGVQGADGRAVQVVQCVLGARPGVAFQLRPQPVAQLRSGLLGEGDGGDPAQRHPVGEHQVGDAPDQAAGLARARAGLHEQGVLGVLGDALSGFGVGQGSVHGAPPEVGGSVIGSMRATSSRSRGSCLTRSQRRRGSA